MKIRAHRALLDDSMETLAEIEPTKEAVTNYFRSAFPWLKTEMVAVKYYFDEHDARTGWAKTFVVSIEDGVLGFTDEPCLE